MERFISFEVEDDFGLGRVFDTPIPELSEVTEQDLGQDGMGALVVAQEDTVPLNMVRPDNRLVVFKSQMQHVSKNVEGPVNLPDLVVVGNINRDVLSVNWTTPHFVVWFMRFLRVRGAVAVWKFDQTACAVWFTVWEKNSTASTALGGKKKSRGRETIIRIGGDGSEEIIDEFDYANLSEDGKDVEHVLLKWAEMEEKL
ncbi:hypothetical protein AgCh_038910 [Apium graveolens]